MLEGSTRVQVLRFFRVWIFSLFATVPVAIASDKWWLTLLGSAIAALEVAYRAAVPATPDVATSPPAAKDEEIPLLG